MDPNILLPKTKGNSQPAGSKEPPANATAETTFVGGIPLPTNKLPPSKNTTIPPASSLEKKSMSPEEIKALSEQVKKDIGDKIKDLKATQSPDSMLKVVNANIYHAKNIIDNLFDKDKVKTIVSYELSHVLDAVKYINAAINDTNLSNDDRKILKELKDQITKIRESRQGSLVPAKESSKTKVDQCLRNLEFVEIETNMKQLIPPDGKIPDRLPNLKQWFDKKPWMEKHNGQVIINHELKNKAYIMAHMIGNSVNNTTSNPPQFTHIDKGKEFQNVELKVDPSSKKLTSERLKKKFNLSGTSEVKTDTKYYDYGKTSGHPNEFYVVFANKNFGGGTFHDNSLVMEELLSLSSKTYLEVAANDPRISVRTNVKGNRADGVGGSPMPYVIRNAEINQKILNLYGSSGDRVLQDPNLTLDNLLLQKKYVEDETPPKSANFISIASPKLLVYGNLQENHNKQWDADVLIDNLNTIIAGIDSVIPSPRDPNSRQVIHSGRLGCGVFNNNPDAMYLLHRLAAKECNVDLVLHDYGPPKDNLKTLEDTWKDIEPKLEGKTLAECAEIIAGCKGKFNPRPLPGAKLG